MNKIKNAIFASFPSVLLISAVLRIPQVAEIFKEPLFPILFILDIGAMVGLAYFTYWFFMIYIPRNKGPCSLKNRTRA